MDPNANLYEQIKCATRIIHAFDNADEATGEWTVNQDDAYRLAETVCALDQWIRKGGFLPTQWERGK